MRPNLLLHVIFLFSSLFLLNIDTIGQANVNLSNLASPTAVNQSLLPNATNIRDLGSATRSWRNIFITGYIYTDGVRFLSNPGTQNIFLGLQSGVSNTTGINNIGIGDFTVNKTTTGSGNIGQGTNSLFSNVNGLYNTAVGFSTMVLNVSGGQNTAAGAYALYNNTASFNTANGYQALYSNTSGNQNTANGHQALYFTTTGTGNSAYGVRALRANTIGNQNSAFGYQALMNNTNALNAAFGSLALLANTSGSANTGVGYSSLSAITTQTDNTAIGFYAGALRTATKGTFLGTRAWTNANGYTNVIVIGTDALGTASNQVRIGNTAMTSIGGYRAWSNLSDGRFKKNVQENVPGIEFLMHLRPVTYTLDMDALDKALAPKDISDPDLAGALPKKDASINVRLSKIVHTGFVAQEVEEAAKKLDFVFSGVDAPKNESDLYSLRYSEFVVPLVKAVQELVQKNNELEDRVAELEKLLSDKRIPVKGYIAQNSPNPFSSTTVIRYSLPEGISSAKVDLTNVKGQLVRTFNLPNDGTGQLQISKGTLAAGNYYYTLWIDGEKTNTRKMIIVK